MQYYINFTHNILEKKGRVIALLISPDRLNTNVLMFKLKLNNILKIKYNQNDYFTENSI